MRGKQNRISITQLMFKLCRDTQLGLNQIWFKQSRSNRGSVSVATEETCLAPPQKTIIPLRQLHQYNCILLLRQKRIFCQNRRHVCSNNVFGYNRTLFGSGQHGSSLSVVVGEARCWILCSFFTAPVSALARYQHAIVLKSGQYQMLDNRLIGHVFQSWHWSCWVWEVSQLTLRRASLEDTQAIPKAEVPVA